MPGQKRKAQNIPYVVIVEIQKKKLSARILAVNFNSAKIIEGIPLSGDLREDKKRPSDFQYIHKALFGQEGIAVTRILYTVKSKGNDNKWVSEVWEADYDGANAVRITGGCGYCVTQFYCPPALVILAAVFSMFPT